VNTNLFLTKIEAYYEQQYSPQKRSIIGAYLETKTDGYKGHLFVEVVRVFSGQYKTLPDIAVFEKCEDEALRDLEREHSRLAGQAPLQIEEDLAKPEDVEKFFEELAETLAEKKNRA
jgi:hypothetical protein